MSLTAWHKEDIGALIERGLILEQIDGNHGELYPKSEEFVSSGVPYLSANCIVNGRVDLSKAKYLTPERAATLKKGKAKRGDVLFAHNATVGPVAVLDSVDEAILSTTLTLYRCNDTKLNKDFLRHFMESSLFRQQYERVMGQSTRNQVPITTQREFWIYLPDITEQKKIAEILSNWDRAIEIVDKEMGAYSRFYKGAVRQILSRLESEDVALTEICNPKQHKTISAADFSERGFPVFGANGFVGFYTEYTHAEETIAITCRGSTCGTVNLIPPKTYITGNSMALNDLDEARVNKRYLYHFLLARGFEDIISGSAQPQIVKSAFEIVQIALPNLTEQGRIADALDALYLLIDRKKKLSNRLKNQKQGLMQKLLTGKVRVKV